MVPETVPSQYGELAISLGLVALVVFVAVELFGLGYYGLGFSPEASALQNISTAQWPIQVKTNIQTTYAYYFMSMYVCMMSAVFVYSNHALFYIFSSTFMMFADFAVEAWINSGKRLESIDSRGVCSKQKMTWLTYCGFLGGLASPSLLFGANTVKAALNLTLFLILLLIPLSLTAPIGKFESLKKSLRVFEVVVLVGTIGNSIFPVTTFPGGASFSLSCYGGLILFQLFFLCHSQNVHMTAYNASPVSPFCPPAMCIPILLDTISIYSRITAIMPSQ